MKWNFTENLQHRVAAERENVKRGEKREPLFSDPQQGRALRLLAGFFSLMLVFTLLSRTAASASMPRVTVTGFQGGNLQQGLQLSGTLQANRTEDISLPGGIRVAAVYVREGDQVEAGQVLMELDQESLENARTQLQGEIDILNMQIRSASQYVGSADSSMLDRANYQLNSAQEAFDQLLQEQNQQEQASQEKVNAAQGTYDQAQQTLQNAQENLDAATAAYDQALAPVQAELDRCQQQYDLDKSACDAAAAAVSQADTALKNAQAELDRLQQEDPSNAQAIAQAREVVSAAQVAKSEAESELMTAQTSLASSSQALETARANYQSQQQAQQPLLDQAQTAYQEAKNNLDSAQGDLSSAQDEDAQLQQSNEQQAEQAQQNVDLANLDVSSAQNALSMARQNDAKAYSQQMIEKKRYELELSEKQRQLALLDGASEGKLTAPVSGMVSTIAEASSLTQEGVPAAILTYDQEGLYFCAQTDLSSAAKIPVGTAGTVTVKTNSGSQTVAAAIQSVGSPDSSGMVTVTAAVEGGNLSAGASASFDLQGQSQRYAMVVPLTALRSVNGKNVVFVVRDTQTVTGTQPCVAAVEVEVLDTTAEYAAINGALVPEDQIVKSASKPIAEGDRVRVEG